MAQSQISRTLGGTSGGSEKGFHDQPSGFHGFSGPAAAGQPASLMGTFRSRFTPRRERLATAPPRNALSFAPGLVK